MAHNWLSFYRIRCNSLYSDKVDYVFNQNDILNRVTELYEETINNEGVLKMEIKLNYKDVAAKLFEQFREEIREHVEEGWTIDEMYPNVWISGDASDNYLSNCVETFKYLDEKFYNELKGQIIWYIEGEIEGP